MDFICPCCQESFTSAIKLKNHINKVQERKHILLSYIYNFKDIKTTELPEQYDIYIDAFNIDDITEAKNKINEIHTRIIQHKDELKKQAKIEKLQQKAYEKSERIRIQEQQAIKIRAERKILQDSNKRFFKNLPDEDKPLTLLNYFYSLINGKCYNYPIEIKLIQGLYTKNELSADQIRNILHYMAIIGKRDLRSINYIIADALYFSEQVSQLKRPNTIPNLIYNYYQMKGIKLNPKKFISEINNINQTMTSRNINFNQANQIIKNLAKQKNSILAWFDSAAVRYLSEQNKQNTDACVYYSQDREVNESLTHLLSGNIKLTDLDNNIKNICINKLTDILTSGTFNKDLNYSEFAFKLSIPLNDNLKIFIRNNDNLRESFFKKHYIINSNSKLSKLYNEYTAWKKIMGI